MNRWLVLVLTLCLLPAALLCAAGIEPPRSCVRCGMDRTVFAYSRAVVSYADGTSDGTCSIHCAVDAMKKAGGKKVAALTVADYYGRQLIDARSAVWVVGGKKNGVMTSPAKWAFADRSGADKFLREYGGSITAFETVLQAVQQEVEEMEKTPEPE